MTELRRLEAKDPVLSSNQPIRRDGAPYAARRIIHDPEVAVYFVRGGRPLVMAQDRYWRLVDNIRSLALAIEGLRKLQRHGGGIMLERASAASPPCRYRTRGHRGGQFSGFPAGQP